MFVHNRVPDLVQGRMRAGANARWEQLIVAARSGRRIAGAINFSFHVRNDLFRLAIPPVNH